MYLIYAQTLNHALLVLLLAGDAIARPPSHLDALSCAPVHTLYFYALGNSVLLVWSQIAARLRFKLEAVSLSIESVW